MKNLFVLIIITAHHNGLDYNNIIEFHRLARETAAVEIAQNCLFTSRQLFFNKEA